MPAIHQAQTWDWVSGTEDATGYSLQKRLFTGSNKIYWISTFQPTFFSTAHLEVTEGNHLQRLSTDARVECFAKFSSMHIEGNFIYKDTLFLTAYVRQTFAWGTDTFREGQQVFAETDSNCNIISVREKTFEIPDDYVVGEDGFLYFSYNGQEKIIFDSIFMHYADACIGKMDRYGKLSWIRIFKGEYGSRGMYIGRDMKLYYLISDAQKSTLYKSDLQGTPSDSFSFKGFTWLNDIGFDNSGNVYLTGATVHRTEFAGHIVNETQLQSGLVIKLDKHLNYQKYWYLDKLQIFLERINFDREDNMYLSGRADALEDSFFLFGNDTVPTFKYTTAFVLKIDSTGKLAWYDHLVNRNALQSLGSYTTVDACGNLYFGWHMDGQTERLRDSQLNVRLGDFQIQKKIWLGNILAKLNPDSLIYEVERGCGYVRIINKSDRSAYTKFEWIGPGGTVFKGDTLVFTDNSMGNEVRIGLKGYKPGGCTNIYSNVVDFRGINPVISILPVKDAICTGRTFRFYNNSSDVATGRFTWDFGDGSPLRNGVNPYHLYTTPGKHLVTITYEDDHCTEAKKDTFTVEVFPTPNAWFKVDTSSGCVPLELSLQSTKTDTAGLGSVYDLADGRLVYGHNVEITYPQPGAYKVKRKVTSPAGCWDEYSYTFEVWPESHPQCRIEEPHLYIPNAFTPDNDRLNDHFSISVLSMERFHIEIFNSLGVCIFNSELPDFSWDGKVDGIPQPPGSYLYRIQATGTNGKEFNINGVMHLLR